MTETAKNGYEVQISKISPTYWTVSRNKDGEPAFLFDDKEKAKSKFNELLNEEWDERSNNGG